VEKAGGKDGGRDCRYFLSGFLPGFCPGDPSQHICFDVHFEYSLVAESHIVVTTLPSQQVGVYKM